mmetsp:Transcript_111893/g.182391  ORF Transcript_111893/g.182391 Transcript_111893/m.182391 type:complete len:322 (-) Transcript_111893:63-1028(-)
MGKKRGYEKEEQKEYDEKKEKKKTRTANFSELSWESLLEREKELAKEEKEMGHLLNRKRAESTYIYGNNELRQQSTKRFRAEYAHSEVKREIERRTRAMEGNQPNAPVGQPKGGGKKSFREPPQERPQAVPQAGPQAGPPTEFQKQLMMQASASSSSSSAAAPSAPAPNVAFDPSLLANHLGVQMPPLEQEEPDKAKDEEPAPMQAFDPALLARRLSGSFMGISPAGLPGHSGLPGLGPAPTAGFTAPSALSATGVPGSLAGTPVSLANTPVQLRIPQAGHGSVLPVMPVVRPLQTAPVAPVASAPGASNVPLAFRNMMRK